MNKSTLVFLVVLISGFIVCTELKLEHCKSINMNSKIAEINLRTRRSANESSLLSGRSNQTHSSTSEPNPKSEETSEPRHESDGKSGPSPESDSTSEPSPESDRTPEPSSESEATSKTSPESDGTSEPSHESDSTSQPSPESDVTSEPSHESDSTSQPSPESAATSEPSPEREATSELSPESDGTSEPSPESDGTSETSPESEATSEPSPESDRTPEPSSESEATSKTSPESDGTSEPSPESDGTSEPSPEIDGTSEPSPESDGTSEPSPESDGTSEPSPESDGTSEPSPESDGTSEPSPESDSTSEPSPESEATSEPSPESDGTSEPSPEQDGTSEKSPRPENDGTSEPSPESEATSEPSPESDGTSEQSPEQDGTSEKSPRPKNDGTSEPSPENGSKSEPSLADHNSYPEPKLQEVNSTSEPGPDKDSEPEPEPETWPEPGPDWDKAYKLWRNAWPAHTYLFAIIFLLMAFYSGYYVVVNVKDGLGKKYLSISLNVMMCILSITRSFVLFLDPYHQGTLIDNKLVLQMMWSIGTPCLLASDSLCILALAESANVNLMHQRFQRLSNILIIVFLHFVLVITTDVVVSSHSSAKVMILYCQVFSIIWGMLLGVWYFSLAHKINIVLFKAAGRRKSRGDRMYLLLIYLSCAANIFVCVLILYAAVGVFGIYSDVQFVDAWSWFTLQTGLRVSEVFAALLVFTVSAKRNRMKNKVHNAIVCGPPPVVNETTDSSGTAPTVDDLYPAPRCRRMSMFSAVHQSKALAQDDHFFGKDPKLNSLPVLQPSNVSVGGKKSNPPPRGRRMSLFSELHESKLSTTSHGRATSQRNKFSGLHQSQNLAVESGNQQTEADNKYQASGRRMSMFSQLEEIKLSADANNSTTSSLRGKRKPSSVLSKPAKSTVHDGVRSGGNGRRMRMFSQLQQIKLYASANSFPTSAYGNTESDPNEGNKQADSNTRKTGIFTEVHQLVASHKKRDNKSEQLGENSKHSNFFSKFFHSKVVPVRSTSSNGDRRLKKLAGLCRNDTSVETVGADVHVNDTPNACERTTTAEWKKSRTRLLAGLRDVTTKLDEMTIIEDEEEIVEKEKIQVLKRKKSSRACATDIDGNKDTVIAMNDSNKGSMSISQDSDQLTHVDM